MSTDDLPDKNHQAGDYFDRVEIEVRPIHGLHNTDSNESWFITLHASRVDKEWLRQQVVLLGYTEVRDELGNVRHYENPIFSLDVVEKTTTWGFDAAILELLLQIPIGAVSGALGSLITEKAKRIAERTQQEDNFQQPLTEQELIERVTWTVVRRFHIERSDLKLISVETSGYSGTVVLSDSDKVHYSVRLEIHDGLVTVAQVRREFDNLT